MNAKITIPAQKPGRSEQIVCLRQTNTLLTANYHFAYGKLTRTLLLTLLFLLTGITGVWGQITPTTDTSNPPVYYLFQSFGNTSFYMRPNGTKVNTSNILTDDMKWYFLNSDESGYYYICDKDGNYLYFSKPSGSTSNRTWLELKNSLDDNDKAHYKYSITKNNTKGWNAYNIIPYGNTDKYCLNKQGRNAGTGNVQVSNGWDDENSNWVIIPMTDYVWTLRADCFRPSDSSNKNFYRIKSKVDDSYYIKPGTTYVETSNTVDDDMIWYFEEASSDDYMTYYYIRLANDGKYLRYRSTAGGQDNAIELASHTGSETGDAEDRFQFIVVRGAVSDEPWNTTNISYNIVPKLLKRTNNNINFFCVSSNQGLGKPLKTRNDRASTDNKWTFVSVDFPTICAKPTITFSNATGKASITTTTTRSTIYYTTDGSEPSSNGEVYTAPFVVTEQTTIKAFVTRTDFSPSDVTTKTIYKVATPSIQNTEAGVISITTATSDATIYYTTDGSTPTTSSTQYTEPVTITASSVTIKAIAVKDGMINSAVSSESFAFACATPTISFDNTTNIVTIASETGSTIYYAYGSTDPADPTVDEGVAHGSSPVSFPISAKTYIKALAVKEGLSNSAVQSVMIDKVSAPVIDVTDDGKVKLTSSTPGVTIYYEIGDDASSVATPTTSSTRYTSPLSNVAGKVIKAIAVKNGWITSDIGGSEGPISMQCAMPVIRRGIGNTFTITCSFPAEGVHIYYTTGNGDPSTLYEGPVSIATYPVTVKAVARADGYNDSSLAEETITQELVLDDGYYLIASAGDYEKFVTMANSSGAGVKYKVIDNFTVSGNTTVSTEFTGTFDGGGYTINGLTHPLFNTVNGGTVKNVTLKGVAFSNVSDNYVGAIAGIAKGYSRIYNCGILPNDATFPEGTHPTVTTSGACAGGIVGSLEDDSRVINCYSYADVRAATTAAGIVGNNGYASTAAVTNGKYADLRTAVVNCMFYGNITGGSNQYGVYGGSKILNTGNNGINNYNFYREKASLTPTDNNCSWPASEENLTRFEYYRYLLNSNRELCGWWVGAPSAPREMSAADVQAVAKDASLMAKWVLDPSIAPYPILKTPGYYPSAINQVYQPIESSTILSVPMRFDSESKNWVARTLSTNTIETNAAPDIEGQTLGTVSVKIQAGNHHSATDVTRTFTITAMDIANNDFCYGKIQLPYYNDVFGNPEGATWSEKYGDNYTAMVVTGWDITTSEGTTGTFSEDPITGYNFADRNCTAKDTHRTFAQGGFYYVPYGVTSITITAHWANAYYLSNTEGNYDRVYFSENNANTKSSGHPFAPAGTRSFGSNDFGGQTINNNKTITSILTDNNTVKGNSVYDCAIVLVGNYQYRNNTEDIAESTRKPFTLMTVDLDFDNEPDYCFEWQFGGGGNGVTRAWINPVRFDFLPIVELGIAMKEDNSKYNFAIGKVTPYGHFEVTETALIHMGQFEYDDQKRDVTGPVILNNGTFDQICRGSESNDNQHVNYFILGGHVKMPSFTPGSHVKKAVKSRHCAVNVLGGEIPYFYLSGNYIATPTNVGNPHCYIDGGKLDFVASGAKEKIVGDVFWEIDHAYIGEFYGGGINADKAVAGNIDITINRSKVWKKFCGGPQFGNMYNGKTVTTRATGTTFEVFYGAGNGGTCYSQYDQSDNTPGNPNSYNWESTGKLANYTALTYRNKATGYHAKYELEMINSSAGTMNNAVCRTYMYAAQFATTNTGTISSTLTDCTVETNFFGGGLLGGVNGSVTSKLTGHTVVKGNAYGAGYGIANLTVDVLPKETGNTYTPPTRNENTSVITPATYPTATTYTWTNNKTFGNTTLSTTSPAILNPNGDGKNYLYTEISLDNLGTVTGAVTLTITGSSVIGTTGDTTTGHVFGGGDESEVDGSTTVNISGTTQVLGNVFGGGNEGMVSGNTTVNIRESEPEPENP